MHSAALQLAPVLAEKSKVPFYVAGGVLVLWALTVSAGLGLRRAAFPFSLGGERVVIAISVVLVLTVTSMAVITSGAPAHKASEEAPAATSKARYALTRLQGRFQNLQVLVGLWMTKSRR